MVDERRILNLSTGDHHATLILEQRCIAWQKSYIYTFNKTNTDMAKFWGLLNSSVLWTWLTDEFTISGTWTMFQITAKVKSTSVWSTPYQFARFNDNPHKTFRVVLRAKAADVTRTWLRCSWCTCSRCQQVTCCCCCCCVRMDDNSCAMKLIEIVPVNDVSNCFESADVKLSPCHIKVCTQHILYLSVVV